MSQVRFFDHQPQVQDYLRQPSSSPVMHRATLSAHHGAPPLFKAPAHKHAHHLHSIPPREKSTRTLIIDHLLWVHARTRFAQARAELGMTDRTGGSHSANYIHRERPENYEEDEEVFSDGEDVFMLTARSGGPDHAHGEEEEERLEMQDLNLARSLRQRAESVEKVTTSMLDQPPEIRPLHPDDLLDIPTSPQLLPQNLVQQHILPNGVRLRLALATVVNDLFSRKAPSPHNRIHTSLEHATMSQPPLPPALIPLSQISAASLPPSAIASMYHRPQPSEYIRSLYSRGSDPDTSNSPPSLRCPRHLHMGCEICVEAKVHGNTRPARTRTSTGRAGSTTGSSPGDAANGVNGNGDALVGGVTGWQDGSGIGSGLARPGPRGTVLRRASNPTLRPSAANEGGVLPMQNTKLAELIVRFMRLSALVALELGREATEDRMSVDGDRREDDTGAPSTSPNVRPAMTSPQTSPRALPHRGLSDINVHGYAFRPSREWYFLLAGLLTRAVFEGYMTAQWRGIEPLEVLLGVGLGLTAHQKKSSARTSQAEGPSESNQHDDLKLDDDDQFKEFDPDDLPDLEDAARVLFPSLRDAGLRDGAPTFHHKEGAELEYQIEMIDRLGRFYDVPRSTPDLATHMEDLAWQFPAEVVERAAVRFCEAVARWRGKPELETYKKASWVIGQKEATSASGSSISIDSLMNSSPTNPTDAGGASGSDQRSNSRAAFEAEARSRKPPIEKYFTPPQSVSSQGRKRRRSEAGRGEEGRRVPSGGFS